MANIISSLIVELVANTAKFSSGMEQANKSIDSMRKSLSLIKFDAIVNLGERAISAGRQLMSFLDVGAKAKQMEMSFNMITDASGIMGDKLIDEIKKASGVFVEETGVMQKAQRAMVEGLSPEQIVDMTTAARVAARLMGTDVKEAFDQVMEAVISLRTRGLKSAFPMEAEEVYKRYAESLGRTADELTEYGKREALVNEIRDQTIARLEKMGELQETEAEKIEKARSTWDSITEAISKAALEGLNVFSTFAKKFGVDMTQMEESAVEGEIIVVGAISNIDKKISEISSKAEDKLFKIPAPEKDWVKDIVASMNKEIEALSELGIISQKFFTNQTKWAEVSFANVKKAFEEGKLSVVDYGNALKAMTEMFKKGAGEDVTDQLVELDKKTQDSIDRLDRQAADYEKQYNRIVEQSVVERNKILEKSPTYIRANLSKWEEDLREAKRKYDEFVRSIESTPPSIGAQGGGGGATIPTMPEELGGQFEVNFIGQGMSPPMPLGEAFDKLGRYVSQAESDMASLKFAVDFSGAMSGMSGFESRAKELNSVVETMNFLFSSFGSAIHSKITGFGGTYQGRLVAGEMQETLDKIFNNQIAQLQKFLEFSGRELTAELWSRFVNPIAASGFPQSGGWTSGWKQPFSYEDVKGGFSSYQFGTAYVPRTGLAVVHEGERITSKVENRNVSMGGVTINITGNDPKRIAEAVAQALQYDRSGALKKQLKRFVG